MFGNCNFIELFFLYSKIIHQENLISFIQIRAGDLGQCDIDISGEASQSSNTLVMLSLCSFFLIGDTDGHFIK